MGLKSSSGVPAVCWGVDRREQGGQTRGQGQGGRVGDYPPLPKGPTTVSSEIE